MWEDMGILWRACPDEELTLSRKWAWDWDDLAGLFCWEARVCEGRVEKGLAMNMEGGTSCGMFLPLRDGMSGGRMGCMWLRGWLLWAGGGLALMGDSRVRGGGDLAALELCEWWVAESSSSPMLRGLLRLSGASGS